MSERIEKRQTLPLVSKTEKISMKLIDPFPNHPFYVFDDNEMLELIESIKRKQIKMKTTIKEDFTPNSQLTAEQRDAKRMIDKYRKP